MGLIELWKPDVDASGDLDMLAEVLHACVHGGASVSFILPFSVADAKAFWSHQVAPAVWARSRSVFVARMNGRIAGTVQLDFATPPNQPHRAEVKKLLVHPKARRQGIARSLMLAAEQHARAEQRTLLTLDTTTGSAAEPLYLSLGYVAIGAIPNYSLKIDSSGLEPTTVMYKQLSS